MTCNAIAMQLIAMILESKDREKVLLDYFINHQPFICGECTGYIETFFFIGADNLILSGVYFRMKDSDSFMKRHRL